MKKQYMILCFLMLFKVSIFGQATAFEKVFDWTSWDFPLDFIATVDNGYALLASSGGQLYVMKLNSDGDSLWSYKVPSGTGWDAQIIQSQSTDLLISGQINGNGSILRLSNSGDSISCITYPYTYDGNFLSRIVEMDDGDLVTTNIMVQNGGNAPPLTSLVCFDQTGGVKWTKGLGDHNPFSLILTSDNYIVTTGLYDWWDMKIWVAKFDSVGIYIFSNDLDASQGNQIIESSEGELYASVHGYSDLGNYNAMKLNSAGAAEWKLFNNNGDDGYSYTICQINSNRFAIGGQNQSGLAIKIFSDNGDSIGFYNYDQYYGQGAMKIFKDDEYLVIGGYKKEPDENRSILVLKILIDSIYTSSKAISLSHDQNQPIVSPNPAKNIVHIHNFNNFKEPTTVNVYSLNGDLKQSNYFSKTKPLTIDISLLNEGIYIMKISTLNNTKTLKFTVSR